MARDYVACRCVTCKSGQLGMVQELVEVIVIGVTPGGEPVGDGGPEYIETDQEKPPPIWCFGCNGTTQIEAGTPKDEDDEAESDDA